MSAELLNLQAQVAELRATFGGGHNAPSWSDLDDATKKATAGDRALAQQVADLRVEVAALTRALSTKAAPAYVDTQVRTWATAGAEATRNFVGRERLEIEQHVAATAGAAAQSARAAEHACRIAIDRAVDTIKAASFHFAHGE
jgi:hypothetical protein